MADGRPPKRPHVVISSSPPIQRSPKRPRYASEFHIMWNKLTDICSYDQETIVAVLIGPDERRFAVHKDVICAKSGFFRAACSTRWREGLERLIRLPEVQPNIFQAYVDWTYTGKLRLGAAATFTIAKEPSCRGIVELYLLGDVLDNVELRNKAMKLLSAHVTVYPQPSFQTIDRIWKNTPTNSVLRNWVVDFTILGSSREYFAKHAEDYPADFMSRVATRLLQQTEKDNWLEMVGRLPSQEYLEPESDALAPGA
jgi:hypothetical protein